MTTELAPEPGAAVQTETINNGLNYGVTVEHRIGRLPTRSNASSIPTGPSALPVRIAGPPPPVRQDAEPAPHAVTRSRPSTQWAMSCIGIGVSNTSPDSGPSLQRT